jgi:hypothetical protein
LTRWLEVMNLRGLPAQFGQFRMNLHGPINFARSSDLTNPDLLDEIARPFAGYFDTEFRAFIADGDFDLVGLSVNYVFQLPYAIWMSRAIARIAPRTVLCVGGTEIADVVKYSSTRLLFRLFASCHVAVLGEGESAFVEILRTIEGGEPLRSSAGIVARDNLPLLEASVSRYEDLASLPAPRYDIWNWDLYWSPEPVILYSPTRGCYWNRCTFCDYGLNTDGPTSPARERPPELVLADLTTAMGIGRTFYFAVDAIPPAYLRRLCAAIAGGIPPISWAAEMRLEGGLASGLADQLAQAGCVALSFGYESGSQRILRFLDKAQKIDQVPSLLRACKERGIACQLMGFIGFPTETLDEALETYRVLSDTRDSWALSGIGDYVLTPGAIVAKNPERFGISACGSYEGEDIRRWLWWKDGDGVLRYPGDQREASEVPIAAVRAPQFRGNRPFLGGIDSAHSILYFRQFGPNGLNERTHPDDFSGGRCVSRLPVGDFVSADDLAAFHQSLRREGRSAGWAEISDWLDKSLSWSSREERREIAIAPNGSVASVRPTNSERTFTIVPA